MSLSLTSTHWGVYEPEVRDGRLVDMKPFRHDPDPSPIGASMVAATVGPQRVMRPAIRRSVLAHGPGAKPELRGAEPFVEVSWEEALDFVARELTRVRTEFGNEAIYAGSYGWASAGRFHHAQSQGHRFMNSIGGFVSSYGSYSLAAAYAILPHVALPMPQLRMAQTAWSVMAQHTRLFVAFGGMPVKNSQVNSGGASEHELSGYLQRMSDDGVAFVNVSPVASDLHGARNAEWIAIRPNTDVAFMLGLAHTLISEGLHATEFLARYCEGFEPFKRYVMGEADGIAKSAAWAAGITDVPAQTIEQLARRMAANRTMINTAWSLQRTDHGEQPFWMTVALASLLGQIGLPGGGFGLGYGAVNAEGATASTFSGPVLPQGKNPVSQFIPVARVSDLLLNPGGQYDFNGRRMTYPDIKLVYWFGGNPFHHHQDLNRLIEAWRRPQTIVAHEQFWNAHAKMADVVMPATTTLERDDIGSAARDRFIIAMKRAIDPVGEARDDHDIFSALARRIGKAEFASFTEGRSKTEWLRHLYETARVKAKNFDIELPGFEAFWSEGFVEMPRPGKATVLFESFRADPVANRLPTPSGRLELFSSVIDSFGYDDCPGHPAWLEPAEWLGAPLAQRFPLHLLSPQPATRLHGQFDNGTLSLATKINGREPVTLHPEAARVRGIKAGDVVRVFNDRGACLAGVRIDENQRADTVLLATGAWYDPLVPGEIGTLDKHGNPNVLTLDKGTSKLGQGPAAHTALVEVERYTGELPAITAFELPSFVGRQSA
ncbi:MAG: torG [Betaproteobacteria bacterium]|nr:torG [Betaproteobacteria bacterium]